MTHGAMHMPSFANKKLGLGASFDIAFVLGFGTFLVLGRRSYTGFVFTNATGGADLSGALFILYIILCAGLALAAYMLRHRLHAEGLRQRGALFACMLLSALGAFLVSTLGTGSGLRVVASVIGVVLFSVGSTAMALGFFLVVLERKLHIRQLGTLVATSYLIASLISLCSSLISGLTAFVFTLVCPLATSVMWLACCYAEHPEVPEVAKGANGAIAFNTGTGAGGNAAQPGAAPEKPLFLFDAGFLAFAFLICSMLLGCSFGKSLSGAVTPVYIGTHFVLLLVCGLLICLFALLKESKLVLTALEIAGVLVIIAAFFFLALANTEWVERGANIVASSRLCFEMLLWLVVFGAGVRQPQRAMAYFAGLLGLRFLSDVMTNLVAPGLTAAHGEAFVAAAFKVSLALFFVLALGFLAFKIVVLLRGAGAGGAGVGEGAVAPAAEPQDTFVKLCDDFAAQFDLSPREREIMALIARGYSSRRIAEALTLSVSTVQTHSKNIYRKLGIHSKQDLIELTAGALPEK